MSFVKRVTATYLYVYAQNNTSPDIKLGAATMLLEIRKPLIRFLADPYDDTTSTIFPLLSSILGTVWVFHFHSRPFSDFRDVFQLKKIKRSEPEKITDDIRAFLSSAVEAILQKMKWDDDAEFDDIDEDDKHTFEALRKVSFSSGFDPEPDLNMG